MGISRLILAVVGIGLTIALFVFGPTKEPINSDENVLSEESIAETQISLDELIAKKRKEIPDSLNNAIASLESDFRASRSKIERLELLNRQFELVHGRSEEWSALLYLQMAEIEETPIAWDNAGDQFAKTMFESKTPELKNFMANKALESYENALVLAPDSTSYKLKKASVYLDGMNKVMDGVQILLQIVENEPLNIDANLILGRYGLISGQIQKAISRFELVLEADDRNSEAYFYLGEAYQQAGDVEAAVRNFENCKKLVDEPGFHKEIDKLIESITNAADGS